MTTTTTTPLGHFGLLLTFLLILGIANAFTAPHIPIQPYRSFDTTILSASSVPFTIWDALPKIRTMSKIDMKQELETYGVSTEKLSSKKELTRALQKARRAQASSTVSITKEEEEQQQEASNDKWSASGFFEDYNPVNFRRESEQDSGWEGPNIWNMHPRDMRMELEQEYGISTENLLERRQLARALEDARREASTHRRHRRAQHFDDDEPAFWSPPPDATRPHATYAHDDDPYQQHPPPPPPPSHSYSHHYEHAAPKNEFVNYAYAGSNGGDFYRTSATADFLDKQDIIDAEVESITIPQEEKSLETREVVMHRYDPRASYMGLIIDTDVSP
jgi:hypothetical protein